MSDTFKLDGSWSTTPSSGVGDSGCAVLSAPLTETITLEKKLFQDIVLDVDAPVVVSFGGLTAAHVVSIATQGQKIRARMTSADGTDQSVPIDDLFLNISRTVPITAIDLMRVAGAETLVKVFLGQTA